MVYCISINFKDDVEVICVYVVMYIVEEVKVKFNKEGEVKVVIEEVIYEKFWNIDLLEIVWKVGVMISVIVNECSWSLKFFKIEEVIFEGNKILSEVCGYVIVDYQDCFEKEWVVELCKSYEVKIDDKVFCSFIC